MYINNSILILFFLIVQSVGSSLFTITKLPYEKMMIYTLNPESSSSRCLLTKLVSNNNKSKNYIYNIIFFKNAIVKDVCDENFLDDEHFCSRLCDRGYCVHIVTPLFGTLVQNFISIRDKSKTPYVNINNNNNYHQKSTVIKQQQQYEYSDFDFDHNEFETDLETTFPCDIPKLLKFLNLTPITTSIIVQELAIPSFLKHLTDVI